MQFANEFTPIYKQSRTGGVTFCYQYVPSDS